MSRPTRRVVLQSTAAALAAPSVLATGCAPEDAAPDPAEGEQEADSDTDASGRPDVDDTGLVDDPGGSDESPLVELDADAVPYDEGRFPHAVSAGAMTTSQVLIVSRALRIPSVRLWIWQETEEPGIVRLVHDEVITPGEEGYLSADVDGLQPDTRYRYGLFILGPSGRPNARSLLGRFLTAPAPGTSRPLTVALFACNGNARGERDVMGRVAEHPDVDVLLHLGDMAYNDGAFTVEEFRRSWRTWMHSPGYRRGLAHTGLYVTWDDHELDNDWDPETTPIAQQEAALRAFLDSVPAVTGPSGELWRSWRWGDTAEILVLDCRSERLPSTILNDDPSDDVYISREQMDWLKDRLENSPCHFKIVMNSVPIARMPWFGIAADDRWEGYPGQREELLDHVQSNDLRNVFFVSGDFHVNFVGLTDIAPTGRLADTWEVAVTSGNINPASLLLNPPQFRYGVFAPRLVKMTFDPVLDEAIVRFYDPETGDLDREIKLRQPA